jgi:predicted nucleic acid-binding protein
LSLTIDASVFVAAARPSEPQHGESLAFLDALAQHFALPIYCPTLTLTETVAAIARRTGDATLAQQAIRQIEFFPGITLVALTQARARRAARFWQPAWAARTRSMWRWLPSAEPR